MVETIEFDDDEDDELPAPITLKDVQLLNKAGQQAEEFAVVANGEGPAEVCAGPHCPADADVLAGPGACHQLPCSALLAACAPCSQQLA